MIILFINSTFLTDENSYFITNILHTEMLEVNI